ncbi:hypothetical protein LTR56_005884 [Elasticomyces elasticus]|nr:hypothetical protein LTR56_005884 [Elasticomyces elasticus]KAK3664890.1 hypothetical protein LTR22_004196 [Elasticomyces elasticus]KAK4912777.1 hypothetical protein LTR49_018846 [Elasticomyces elasticus]KAK5752149.1 hypothetical protein LTS12_017744 [Elasticomyces elasticus]
MERAAGSSSGGRGKGRATEPTFEYYDIEEADTFSFGETTIRGFYKNVTFSDCMRQDTSFNCCTFINVIFENCTFKDTNFLNLYLKDVSFIGIEFHENTWMNDRLEQVTVTIENLKSVFPKQSQVGCSVPFEVIDAEFLQMQLALTDDTYIQLDEDLARRLQFEDDSQPVPHVPEDGGPVVGKKAHNGPDAAIVTGYDKHGFAIVEHPSFPSWLPTTVETVDISGGIPTTRTEGHSAAIMRNMMRKEKEAQSAETVILSEQSTRLLQQEDSQPAPHVPNVNDTGEQADEPGTGEGCLKWTHPSGPAVGQKAHSGYDAGVVTGYDRYGFPQVEHPSFPSWLPTTVETVDISGGITATKTAAGRSAAIMRDTIYEKEANEVVAPDTFTAHQQLLEIDILSSSTIDEATPPHVRCAMEMRRVRDAARGLADQSTDDSSSSSADKNGTGNCKVVDATSPNRQLATNSSRDKQAAAKLQNIAARIQSTEEIARIAVWNNATVTAAGATNERPARETSPATNVFTRSAEEIAAVTKKEHASTVREVSAAMLQTPARIQSADEAACIDAWNNATLAAARATDERRARERTSATASFTSSAADIQAITKRENAGSIQKVDTNSHDLIDISACSNPGQPRRAAPVTKSRTSAYVTTEMTSRTKSKVGGPEPVRSLHAAPEVETPMNAPSVTDPFDDGTKSARRVFRLAGSSDNTPRIFNSSSGSATVSHATQAEDTPEYATVAGGGFGSDGGVRLPGCPFFKSDIVWDAEEDLIEL